MGVGGLPGDLRLLARGWLHGNCLLSDRGELIDTGYHTGVGELRAALAAHSPVPLRRILLTHVHSDHAGGVTALAGAGVEVAAHPDAIDIVARWDERALWLGDSGQELPRFAVDRALHEVEAFAGRSWRVLPTAGHATGGVSFFCEAEGLLVTGDALWERGLGMLNPWADGEAVFAQALAALDTLAATGAGLVVPGHGLPFTDLGGAVARARERVERWAEDRAAARQHALRSALAFWRLAHPDEPPQVEQAQRVRLETMFPA